MKSGSQWSGETGLEIFNTWDLDRETVKLSNLFNRWEDYCKCLTNDLKAKFDLY